MSSRNWKSPVLACAIVLSAFSVTETDHSSSITVAMKPPAVAQKIKPPALAKISPSDADAANAPAVTTTADIVNPPPVAPSVAAAAKPVTGVTGKTPAATPNPPVSKAPVVAEKPEEILSTTGTEVTDDPPPPTFDRRILAAHNRERQALGLEPLNWNPALAESAKRWADHLAQTGRFEHAPENHVAPEGENLWAGTKGYYTPEAMVDAWIREKRFFRPGVFPDNSITGKVEDIGHYTQVVWRATREVGCAEAASAAEDILVCRYAEAGNYRGEQPF